MVITDNTLNKQVNLYNALVQNDSWIHKVLHLETIGKSNETIR